MLSHARRTLRSALRPQSGASRLAALAALATSLAIVPAATVAPAGATASPSVYGLSLAAGPSVTTNWPTGTQFVYVSPAGVAVDSKGDLLIADNGVKSEIDKITPAGVFSVVAGAGSFGHPTPGTATSSQLWGPDGVAVDSSDNIYIADAGNNRIEKVTTDGTLSVIAGNGDAGTPTPGPATSSRLFQPNGVAVDSSGNVYIADSTDNTIDKVTPGGTLSIIAGNGTTGRVVPGPATSSPLWNPIGVAVDSSNNVYIADTGNNRIEKVTPTGTLSVIAGNGSAVAPTAGPAFQSGLSYPEGVAVDSSNNVYIADHSNYAIEKVTPAGTLSIIAGTGTRGDPTAGLATASSLDDLEGIAADSSGNVFVTNTNDETTSGVVELQVLSPPSAPTAVSASPGNAQASVTFTAPSSASPVTSYQVTATDKTKASRGGQTASGATAPIVVSGLTNGDSYTFRVTATSIGGTGAASVASAALTPSTVPSAPTSVSSLTGYHSVALSWAAPASTGGTPVTGYKVFMGTTPGGEAGAPVATVGPSATTVTIPGLTAWTKYDFTVTATNANGPSVSSPEVRAPAADDRLTATQPTLSVNQELDSANGAYRVVLQPDGNLVVYKVKNGAHLFESVTNGRNKGQLLTLLSNGHLQLTTSTSTLALAPKAKAGAATSLVLQNNGELDLLTKSGSILWAGTAANSGG